ncbi:hypothetical protein [Acetobacter vaccinii]|uniref:Uncharacterized protein n=1 Tax=Acetobacter vaccinii TaxID=2592655 RepID=A0A5C1YRE1_9PROT|nr:hypothetical protein [Acetobacter vaccinii]QEO18924.1 hypothetical protein FLP30_13705 [Acetobacter vaccinii]
MTAPTPTPPEDEQARRKRADYEMSLLTNAGEALEALIESFLSHPDYGIWQNRTPALGYTLPWASVSYRQGAEYHAALVVGGAHEGRSWTTTGTLMLFAPDRPAGEMFFTLDGATTALRISCVFPGLGEKRPDARALLREVSCLTGLWAGDRALVAQWARFAAIRGEEAFPDMFVSLNFGGDVQRGLVVDGTMDDDGAWDFSTVITLLRSDGRLLDLDAGQASHIEMLVEGDRADELSRRR